MLHGAANMSGVAKRRRSEEKMASGGMAAAWRGWSCEAFCGGGAWQRRWLAARDGDVTRNRIAVGRHLSVR